MFSKNALKTLLIATTLIGLPAMADQSKLGGGVEKTKVRIGSTCAQRAKFGRKGGFSKKLGLTDAQLVKIVALKDQARVTTAPQKAQLKTLNDQLKDILTSSDSNRQQALDLQGKINDVKDKLASEKLEYRLDFMSVLNPQQKEMLRHRMLVSEATAGHHKSHRLAQT
jgi:Spy/CpxP family protein refolding chaperone